MNDTEIEQATRHLSKTDSVMALLIRHSGPLDLGRPGTPHFHSLVSAIINQQLSVKAGQTIEKRLLTRQGGTRFQAPKLASLDSTELRACGLSSNKVRYVRQLSLAVNEGDINFRKLVHLDDDSIRKMLIQLPGIGPWTIDMFLMNALRRPDVFPVDDLVLRQSMQRHYSLAADALRKDYLDIAARWRPYRSIATYYLWRNRPIKTS
ncbi:MAG: DNA-3-methyladenine glycosylase [Gammaproteobacteria bacterium]|nr:DNA-3-methyladenine glycosylase [Gammaproteobacteria bacterium]